jgi:hypothetical protein
MSDFAIGGIVALLFCTAALAFLAVVLP